MSLVTPDEEVEYWLRTAVAMFAVAYAYDIVKSWWNRSRAPQVTLAQPVVLQPENHYHDHHITLSGNLVVLGAESLFTPDVGDEENEPDEEREEEQGDQDEENTSQNSWTDLEHSR